MGWRCCLGSSEACKPYSDGTSLKHTTPELQIWLNGERCSDCGRVNQVCRNNPLCSTREEKRRLDKKAEQTESLNLKVLTEVNVSKRSWYQMKLTQENFLAVQFADGGSSKQVPVARVMLPSLDEQPRKKLKMKD